jgi:uncharacterized protein (UPF0335 family)
MTLKTLIKKVEKLEKELKEIKMPKKVLGKIFVDKKLLEKAKKALFNFDIEKFVTKKDLKSWK